MCREAKEEKNEKSVEVVGCFVAWRRHCQGSWPVKPRQKPRQQAKKSTTQTDGRRRWLGLPCSGSGTVPSGLFCGRGKQLEPRGTNQASLKAPSYLRYCTSVPWPEKARRAGPVWLGPSSRRLGPSQRPTLDYIFCIFPCSIEMQRHHRPSVRPPPHQPNSSCSEAQSGLACRLEMGLGVQVL